MRKFLLFIVGLVALLVLLANFGPMVILAISVWLLYIVFKKFMESDSMAGKVGWVILGLIILSIGFANIYSILGVVAILVLYWIFKNWKDEPEFSKDNNDPFTNFEREWADLNK